MLEIKWPLSVWQWSQMTLILFVLKVFQLTLTWSCHLNQMTLNSFWPYKSFKWPWSYFVVDINCLSINWCFSKNQISFNWHWCHCSWNQLSDWPWIQCPWSNRLLLDLILVLKYCPWIDLNLILSLKSNDLQFTFALQIKRHSSDLDHFVIEIVGNFVWF